MKIVLSTLLLLMSSTLFADSDWKVVLENDEYTLRCIDFDDHKTAFAVGDSGLILKTFNGGETWQEQSIGVFGNLKLVTVLNQDTALACGDNFIIRTVNGGLDWTKVFTGTDEVIRYLKFMTNDLAEMPGRVIAAGNSGLFLVSNSNGEKWFRRDLSNVSGNVDVLFGISNYFEQISDTFVRIMGLDGNKYESRNDFKSKFGAPERWFEAGVVEVIHTDHKFYKNDAAHIGAALGKNGYFRYLDGGGDPSYRKTNIDMYGGLYYEFPLYKAKALRLCVGKGGVISEGLGAITEQKWRTITNVTKQDLYWVDEGIDPKDGDNLMLLVVGDGVILQRSFGSHPVSATKPIESEFEISVYPNPTQGLANLSYHLENTETVSYQLLDVNGNLIDQQQIMFQPAGDYHLPIDRLYQSGIYIIRLQVGHSVTTQRLVKQ